MASKTYKKVNNGVLKTRPSDKTNIFPRNNSSQFFLISYKTAKVAIDDGQTFSDSIDKKSAGNFKMYYF
jgi:hypothetical protein